MNRATAPPSFVIGENKGDSVTVTVSMAYTPQEGMNYAEFVIQVQWIGLSDTPLSVRVQEYSQTTFDGTSNPLNDTWLTFDSSHLSQSVLVPIADDSDWLPQNSVGVVVTLADSTLTLNSNSVLQTVSPVLENDAYLDPVTGEPDDSLYWQTMEAAQLRSSPYAVWYSLWLPIYAPTDTENSTPTDPSEGQSSPPYVAPTPPPENSQSSPPSIIASAPVVDSLSSQSSSPPATEPIVVTSDTSGAGSSVETTSTVDNSTVDSSTMNSAGSCGSSSGGSSSGDTSLMTATYDAGMSGNGSGSSSGGATDGTDSSSSNTATMNTEMSTTTGSSTTENSLV